MVSGIAATDENFGVGAQAGLDSNAGHVAIYAMGNGCMILRQSPIPQPHRAPTGNGDRAVTGR